jgi:leader peptidase (prepilin peptidase) / N-methyltransferase
MTDVTPLALWAVMAGLLGLAIGSFLNVVIYRLPVGESVIRPASRCPACGSEIHNRHNIPVLGWLILRGRCFACKAPISPRYPLVEALTGVLFAAVTLRIVDLDVTPALPAYLYLVAAGVALAAIDLDHHRLPDKIVLPSYAVVAVLLTVASASTHDWWALARAGIGTTAQFAFYLAIVLAYPAGMGFGDVKLAGVLGGLLAYLSWSALAVGAFAGFALGAVVGVAAMTVRRADRKTAIPFGPFMIAGAVLAIFVATPIADAYLRLIRS